MNTDIIATQQGFAVATEQPERQIIQDDRAVIAQHGLGAWLGSLNSTPTVEYSPSLDPLAEQWLYAYLSETLDVGFAEPPTVSARCGQVYLVDMIPQLLTVTRFSGAHSILPCRLSALNCHGHARPTINALTRCHALPWPLWAMLSEGECVRSI